jgi:hypothetical protein
MVPVTVTECSICSYRQRPPMTPRQVKHSHSSAREIRILQGVEYEEENLQYMCTTCQVRHAARPEQGLNVLVGDSNLHNIHNPRGDTHRCPPDPVHIDWLTVCGATIPELEYAWDLDYGKSVRPMRILLSGGLNDLIKGKSRTDIVASILHFRIAVDHQNQYHPMVKNELVVATVLNAPKLVWFPDNGPPPPNYNNLLDEVKELNAWIIYFNQQKGKITPRFHRLGVKNGTQKKQDGSIIRVLKHQFKQWRQSEPDHDKVHLTDEWRVRMGIQVTRHFKGEMDRFGLIGR